MLSFGFVVSILIQLGLPALIAYVIVRRYKTEWRLVGVGALAYLVFQILQPLLFQFASETEFYTGQIQTLPMVQLALLVGFISAILEQGVRVGSFWYVRKTVGEWQAGLTVAAGHAGVESILVGLQFLINFVIAVSITSSGAQGLELTPEKAAELQIQIASFWALPWYMPLAAALQRVVAMALQFALGMMVWQAVNRRAWVWVGAALLWQTMMSTLSIILAVNDPDFGNMALFTLMGAVNGGIIYWFYRKLGPFSKS